MKNKPCSAIIFMLVFPAFVAAQPAKDLDALYADMQQKKDTALVNTLLDIGLTYRLRSEMDSADHYFSKSVDISRPLNYYIGMCRGIYGRGDLYMYRDQHDSALNLFLDALQLTEKMNPEDRVVYEAKVKQRIGMFYLASDDADNAIKYLKETEALSTRLKDTSNLIDLSKDFAYSYVLKKDSLSAISYYKKGLAYCDALEKSNAGNKLKLFLLNRQRINLVRNSIGIFNTPELNKEALSLLEGIWNTREEAGGRYNAGQILVCLARLYRLTGQPEKAIIHGKLALEDPYVINTGEKAVNLELAEAYNAVGNYKLAYENLDIYFEDYTKRFEAEKFSALAKLETQYQTEKKEQQIAALNKERKGQRMIMFISVAAFLIALGLLLFVLRAKRLQRRLFAKEKELQRKEMDKRMSELEQTALRAQMNPHFIFNSLNSVQRFVVNNDVEGVNQYLTTFAHLIRQTLENSGKPLIPLRDEIRYLETYLKLEQMRSNGKFEYRIMINEDVDTEETYIPNMIIQPYLENSVIHGMAGKKPHEGLINLTISKNHKLTCIVEDNGRGIYASKTKIDTGHESMGTAITEKRIEMFNTVNNDKIELEVMDKTQLNEPESGTRILIKFPLSASAN